MEKLAVAKFGGSASGIDGEHVLDIINRIKDLKKDSKVITVFSAPLTIHDGKRKSLTDLALLLGRKAEEGTIPDINEIRRPYEKILNFVSESYMTECKKIIDSFLEKTQQAYNEAMQRRLFADEVRSRALAFSGEILMSYMMNYIMKSNGIKSDVVSYDIWPIITDNNIESTNFLASESIKRIEPVEQLLKENDVLSIGGFIGKTVDGAETTYERGGSDRTAADLGILFHKKYDTRIDFEKDSAVVSADPRVVSEELEDISQLSYNEARLAGMFGMKILDPIAIKEILENGVDMPIMITNMKNPQKITTIKRRSDNQNGHPLKIVTGKRNCAILKIESESAKRLLESLEKDKRYSEFVILSPFTKDDIEFTRILFLDSDYVKRNERYVLGFDSLATITYNRGVITLIGDEMWRVHQIVSKASSRIGDAGLNILNMDAQEETSRVIIVTDDSDDNIEKAIRAVHSERSKITFT
ncbi:amino acid kinase family protein [Candidatus Nitrosotenuis sp. DW1]|uniref:amino acid kinase family protein n=1 Tax=Candidatus Nitrosotenuis sp. DW1 TaxID=2259672 RepID=UPI0015C7CF59|nr:aspartate kinase [Candidatus Nitrosotenuis sp. DW1]QLH09647.1 aspartate kinase [Candidatus Nitrosotenuis sp. DW1]